VRLFLGFVAAFWLSLALGIWAWRHRWRYEELEPDDPALFV
jgi:ABC-type nitrate/sulfonate/bicarbonate transport system permease component